eukprot:CAMPEP_0117733944 /NCGR_PEP_ID=MMETSP0947-20121206/366_1 /TAXON_ID=44440 /ORGANISM="Chattonella subsalsa, Strain CCMP2191" /LENGTH=210 /DNA_ID=CAMNT_0005548601 /DNA_START=221 /DNA_END=854 /DNA_ORIENTATION=-
MADLGNSSAAAGEYDEEEEELKEETQTAGSNIKVGLTAQDIARKCIENREIGHEAVWSLSTAKTGNGVAQLRDDNTDTYWQSDGTQPHLINIQFHRKMTIKELALFIDYTLDESYTPRRMSIWAGSTYQDLVEIKGLELNEPSGWVLIPLNDPTKIDSPLPLRTFLIQVRILSMHQNGRDNHIRQEKYLAQDHPQFMAKGIPALVLEALT